MSDVTLSVGGRNYTVACAEGDQDRVRELAAMIGERLAGIGATLTTPMEAKNLLIAGLILADELDEARKGQTEEPSGGFGERLEILAERLETTAQMLESDATSA
jgi:cell division protein ZapA